MEIQEYLNILSKPTSEAGGGSVAALNGALASSLLIKAYNMIKKSKEIDLDNEMYLQLLKIKSYFYEAIKKDGESYTEVLNAYKLPKSNEMEIKYRNNQIQLAYKKAANSPFIMILNFEKLFYYIKNIKEHSNKMIDTELDVALNQIISGFNSAKINVLINIKYIKDDEFNNEIISDIKEMENLIKNI